MDEFIEEYGSHCKLTVASGLGYCDTMCNNWPYLGDIKLGHIELLKVLGGYIDAPLVTLQSKTFCNQC